MSWLSISQMNKPANTIWWEKANPEKGLENNTYIQNAGVVILNDFVGLDQNTVTFIYRDEQHYNDFQAEYANNPYRDEKLLYNQENNIVATRIYLGPSDQYTP